ncbi:unnamed protein product [Ambrosiozyma monospora]|uniref:Unnamed protein product n=1 Tax=Ambrosiozyma monospora TaxID=43982 RepID=A0ACB5SWJ0_AMBMO|nr:unnamed protein product [Ambrosiozyma monospora]
MTKLTTTRSNNSSIASEEKDDLQQQKQQHNQTSRARKAKHSFLKAFQFNRDNSPPEIFNATLYLSVFVFGILGAARGYDEGYASATPTQMAFKERFGLNDPNKTQQELNDLKSNIKSMVQLGSIGGSLLSIYLCDKVGRVRTLQFSCFFWIVATVIQITSKKVGQLYAGRLLEGLLGVGPTVVCGPVYLSEVSPKAIRGLCNNIFAGAVYIGIMLGYFSNYGVSLHIRDGDEKQWLIPTSIKFILAGTIFILSFLFCIESPRWLIKKGNVEQASINFSKLRHLPEDHPYILSEISDVNEQLAIEAESMRNTSFWGTIKELFVVYSVRYRMLICISIQVLGQWSGANAVTIYAPELFALVGMSSKTDNMMMTALLGVVKFVSAYLSAFFLIDFLGRRKSLYCGITLQLICMLYFAMFLNICPQAVDDFESLTDTQKRASKGALASLFLSGTAWTMGWNSIQYLINSEILPLRVRNLGTSIIMCFHFTNQYANSKAMPYLMDGMNNYGAFYFFVGVLAMGLFFAWFFLPEVAGRSLESMEELFNLPWYLIGRRGAKLAPDHSEVNRVHASPDHSGNAVGGDIRIDMEKPEHHQIENVESYNKANLKSTV